MIRFLEILARSLGLNDQNGSTLGALLLLER
jgi:hypothetical protein